MSTAAEPDRGEPASGSIAGGDDPTPAARIRVVKTGFSVEVAVPARHTARLLTTAAHAAAAVGVLVGPGLTLRLVPPDFPAWAVVGLIAGQLCLLGLVALIARRAG
ncbi:hypothetical protein [Actinosynnema sp. NPDC023587]|uniref:hypothetical protein n=1 Tax=Actinosynnema sp. NPDC023587 TaxID=3154695 RepID=UPI0033C7A43B